MNLLHPQDGQAMRAYTEHYDYDAVGNILGIIHAAPGGTWTRTYAYQEPSLIESGKVSNRLSSTTVGETIEAYAHDAHGNIIKMPHLPLMQWDYLDRLQATSRQVVSSGTPETTYYVYDAAGQRVRKVTESSATAGGTPSRTKERLYVGGFETYREYGAGGAVTLERESLHVMDDEQRVALVETRTAGSGGSPPPLIRFQLGNHLGSASLELDGVGGIISYEEYTTYGSTSYQAVRTQTDVPAKRYRYTGRERDEETGFAYHGARYYAPWIAVWVSCDPSQNPFESYQYVRAMPTRLVDLNGAEPEPPVGQRPRTEYKAPIWGILGGRAGLLGVRPQMPASTAHGAEEINQLNAGAEKAPLQFGVDASKATVGGFGVAYIAGAAGLAGGVASASSVRTLAAWAVKNPSKAYLVKSLAMFAVGLADPHPPGGSPLDVPGLEDDIGRAARRPLGEAMFGSRELVESLAKPVFRKARGMSAQELHTAIKATWELDQHKLATFRGGILEAVAAATVYRAFEWVGRLDRGFYRNIDFWRNGIGIQLKTLQGIPKVAQYKAFIDQLRSAKGSVLPGGRRLREAALHIATPIGYMGPPTKGKEYKAALKEIQEYGKHVGIAVHVFELKPK